MEYQAFHAVPWQHGSFWVLVAIVIFVGLAGRKILGAINKMLDDRANEVRAALDEAAALKAEAEAILEDAKKRQVQAAKDAKLILASAKDEAARMAAELAADAQANIKRRERMAFERIAAAEATAIRDVRAAAIDIATTAAASVLRESVSPADDSPLIDHAITGVPAALRQTA
jgi:F-type H+-transporting ATPase subunit b